MSIDPTALALLSIFGGVVITVIAGFIGAWIQARREHRKWLREQRYEAFMRVLKLLEGSTTTAARLSDLNKKARAAEALGEPIEGVDVEIDRLGRILDSAWDDLADVTVPMRILGPSYVEDALDTHVPDLLNGDEDASGDAADAIRAAMRKALSVKD